MELLKLIPRFVKEPHEVLVDLSRTYGDIVAVHYPGIEYGVLITNTDYMEHVFHHNNKNYDKSTKRWETLRQLWGNGLLTADGDLWRRQRQLIQPAFHVECLQNFAAIVIDEVQKIQRKWIDVAKRGEAVDAYPDMLSIALRTVVKATFGTDVEKNTDLLIAAVGDTHDYINPVSFSNMFHLPVAIRRFTAPGFKRFHNALHTIHTIFDEILRTRQHEPMSRTDLLGMIMAARDEETGPMSLNQLHDEMMTLLMAGHETTGISTAWSWYWLATHPDVQRELAEEADAVYGGRLPTFDDLPRLQYARMVFMESMRLNPSIWALERKALEEDTIDGYRIPKGASLITSPWVMHRHPKYWDEPAKFNPLRFLPEEEKKRPQYAHFPFGGGPRRCVGLRVGLLQGQLMLSMLAQAFTVRMKPGHPVVPSPRLNMPPKFGLQIMLEPRRVAAPAVAAAAVS